MKGSKKGAKKGSAIHERMGVFGSCGNQLGTVDRVEGNEIKLSKSDEKANGHHHWIPMSWVESVDDAVRLSKGCAEAVKEWRSESVAVSDGVM